ncbi:hypothetical protein PR202_ga17081 [Eleusine coracana subsp. coracana]|uniref:Peptidase A1 domain-containing protein n=1 Tax=Eleusine coracana subsp. coracana TaxID=191504 RepID=A0AAV5CN29_ELECO|nr:hypothetical protein QOZ80_6AG0518790 [Eleusine coracana subsp. coracana]GJM99938.1 hypothetical protein PR202_ga17081 [Eleusine coracana subsp. coracana]
MASSHLRLLVLSCGLFFISLGSTEHNFVVGPTSSFASEPACSTVSHVTSEPKRASIPLVHRHGPCAPTGSYAEKPSLAERLRRDRARRNRIMSKVSGRMSTTLSDASVSIPTALGDAVGTLEYVVTLSIGTPAVEQTMLIDTGSDLSWIQCNPCSSSECYPQKDPLFDPSKSSTYKTISCDSDACKQLIGDHYGAGCTNGASDASLCQYGIKYGSGETTVGLYSTETLTLKQGVTVPDFSFGCGLHQHGEFDKFDGLLGLGGASESFVSQTSHTYGGAFSYCLPPGNGTSGFLTLGAPSNNTGFVFTPMHQFPGVSTFYMVTLTGISVGGKQLDIPPAVFSNGMIIDSGTIITGLPATAYSALRSEFRNAMSAYPLLPPTNNGLDTCYNFAGHSNVTVPKVSLTFNGGATIDLDVPSGVLIDDCLAFVGGNSDNTIGIIGNVNQRTFEVLYDTGRGNVGFRSGAC